MRVILADECEDANITFRKIFLTLLSSIKSNENGVKEGINIESLHDYRVALRKTKTMLKYTTLNQNRVEYFKAKFSYIAKLTNEARDLDIFIENMKEYQSELNEFVRDDINLLIKILKEKRVNEQEILTQYLNSQIYIETLYEWENFLNEIEVANISILEVIREKLYKVFDKVIKKAKKITKNSTAKELHNLRIRFKKFKYLLEFFAPLLEKDENKILISEILKLSKEVQNSLGAFQDFEVQKLSLKKYAIELLKDEQNLDTIMVLGKVFVDLKIKQGQIRYSFCSIFQKFYLKKEEFKVFL